jgi:hypothetical protein
LNQNELEAVANSMRLFLVKLALYYNADFHELEEIIHRSLGDIEPQEAPQH